MVKRAIDGFVPRETPVRRRANVAQKNEIDFGDMTKSPEKDSNEIQNQNNLRRSDIDESLREIDDDQELQNQSSKKSGKSKRKLFGKNVCDGKKRNRKKLIKRAIIILLLLILGIGGYVLYHALSASNSVFKGDVFGLIQSKALKEDANGRSNILILGTSEDDAGHEGGYLTDSMMILSVDQDKKNAYMISVPRDLYVKYGRACDAGYQGKINAYFNCVNSDWTSDSAETERQTAERSFVGDIFGMDIQYSVHVNYTVMRDLVGALGGITITIDSRDPRGVMDSNFDWKCGSTAAKKAANCPRGHYISYPNGQVELDAEHALYLAMARGDVAPTYGFEQSNFDREKNQQKILIAIRNKAMSAGTLSDFAKVTSIIDAVGKNLRTNFETSEVRTLVSLAKNIKDTDMKSVSLIDADPAIVTTGTYGGQSVVIPSAGVFEYSALQAYIKKNVYATDVSKEAANVIVLNATGTSGVAAAQGEKLTDLGMTVSEVGNAPEGVTYSANKIYKVSSRTKTATAKKLQSLYGVKPETATSVDGVEYSADVDFVIIVASTPSN